MPDPAPSEAFEPPVPPAEASGVLGQVTTPSDEEFGLRLEGEYLIPSRSPLTPFGWQALASLRSQLFPGDKDLPAMLAAAARFRDRRFLLEAIAAPDRSWTEEEERLVLEVLEQTALALEHAELFQRIQHTLAETERLYRATTAINQASSYQEILDALREFTILSQDALYVSLVWLEPPLTPTQQPEWIRTLATWSASPDAVSVFPERVPYTMLVDVSEPAPVLSEPGIMVYRNVERAENVHPAVRQVTLMLGGRSALWVPLVLGESVLGFLFAVYPDERDFPKDELRILNSLAIQASAHISTLYLADQTQRALSETEQLYKASMAISGVNTYEGLLRVFREFTVLGDENLLYLGVLLFDPTLTEDRYPDTVTIPAWWSSSTRAHLPERQAFAALFSDQAYFLHARRVQAHEDAETDPSLPAAIRELVQEMRGRAVVLAPLHAGQEVLGLLLGVYSVPRLFHEEELRFLNTLASHAGVRVQSLRLTDELRRLLRMTERLYQAAAALNQARELTDILRILETYTVLEQAQGTMLMVFDPPLGQQPPEKEAQGHVVALRWQGRNDTTPRPPLVLDEESRQQLRDLFLRFSLRPLEELHNTTLGMYLQTLLSELEASSPLDLLLLPLWVGENVIGVIAAFFRDKEALQDQEAQELLALQAQVAVRVDGLLHSQRSQVLAEQLRTVAEIARDIGAALSVQEVLDKAVDLIKERFGFYHVSVFLLDPEGLYATVQASTGPVGEVMKRSGHRLAVGSASVVGQAAERGEPVVINDAERSPIHRPNPLLPQTRAEAALPLRVGNRVIGVLDVQSTQKYAFSDTVIQVLQLMADQLAIAVESARAYDLSRRALEELRRADELKTQFLANMSHELRTPLNSIIGFSRIILKGIDGPITEQQRQDLEAIYNAGQHLLGLINDILDLSKIEAGKMELVFEEVDVRQILESVLATVRGLIKDKPVRLLVDVEDPLPPLYADAKRVRQILLNVLSNAAKFTQEGYIKISARVQTTRSGHPQLLLVVEDTGPGIPKEAQERLFTPFYQADAAITRAVGGTGLGLAITRHLVEMHGGRIWIESEEGKGTKVFITFPIGRPEAEEVAFVLIFDRDDVVDHYREHLGAKGYRIIGTLDPKTFQARLLSLRPLGLIVNPFLPDRQGLELVHQVHRHEEVRMTPTLLVRLVEGRRVFLPPFTSFAVKPLLPRDVEVLERWLSVTAAEGAPRELLLIDRDHSHVEQVQELLEETGWVLRVAPSFNEAFEVLREHAQEMLILMDLLAPGDQVAFLRLLERMNQDRQVPFPVVALLDPYITPEGWGLLDLLIRHWWRVFVYDQRTGFNLLERYFYYFELLWRQQRQVVES